MKDFAREYHAKHLGNCAMSVAAAWLNAHESDPSEVEKFKTCGAGRAPDGLCGALYAATQFMPEKKGCHCSGIQPGCPRNSLQGDSQQDQYDLQ